MPFKQNFSAPDPSKSLLPTGEGLHDSFVKLFIILNLLDIAQTNESKEILFSYILDNWPRVCEDVIAKGEKSTMDSPCWNCKGNGTKHCFPCFAHCWTRCKGWKHCPFPNPSVMLDFMPIGGGIGSEIHELITKSKESTDIISKSRYELGKFNGKCIKEMYKSLIIPKNQGLPLTVTTLLSFAKNPIEHKNKEELDVLQFSFNNFFGFSETDDDIFDKILQIEKCTAGPWLKGYFEEIANVNVEIIWPKKIDELLEIRLKQL